MNVHSRFFNTFTKNGWSLGIGDADDYSNYHMTIVADYNCECYARAATRKSQLSSNGHYGVAWIEVSYESEVPYSEYELKNMLYAIELAENNLLTIGIPFCPDYTFMGRDAANKSRRNRRIRREWELDEKEAQRNDD